MRLKILGASVAALAVSATLALTTGVAVGAAASVTVSGTTITVTDTDGAMVHRLASGETDVDGTLYPDRPNLVVKSLASPTVLMDSALAGDLTISTAVGNIDLGGTGAVIQGNLRVTGGSLADVVSVVDPVLVHGNALFDLKSDADSFFVDAPLESFGEIDVKGANGVVIGARVLAQGDVTFHSKTDTAATNVTVVDRLEVSGDFSFLTGRLTDTFDVAPGGSALFTHDATFNLGNGGAGATQAVSLENTIVNGRLRVQAGSGGLNHVVSNLATRVGRRAEFKLTALANELELRGDWSGNTLIRYTGSGGGDVIDYLVDAPDAKVIVNTAAGMDRMTLSNGQSSLAVLVANLGSGTDLLDLGGYTLPAGSSVKNVP